MALCVSCRRPSLTLDKMFGSIRVSCVAVVRFGTLEAEEFIRPFYCTCSPEGFQRIRYYGFLGNRYREQKLARCRKLLGMPSPEPAALEAAKDYHERYEQLTGSSL
jgi:hypothetical protein